MKRFSALVLVLGLALVGCGREDENSGDYAEAPPPDCLRTNTCYWNQYPQGFQPYPVNNYGYYQGYNNNYYYPSYGYNQGYYGFGQCPAGTQAAYHPTYGLTCVNMTYYYNNTYKYQYYYYNNHRTGAYQLCNVGQPNSCLAPARCIPCSSNSNIGFCAQ